MFDFHPRERLSGWERRGIILFLVGAVLFGLLVEKRSAFLRRRMGDVGVYLRAGWAARMGGRHLYDLTDDNGWHYNYPPLFALLMMPLADPPCRDVAARGAAAVGLLGSPPGPGPLLAACALAASPTLLEPDVTPALPYLPYPVSVAIWYAFNLLCLAWGVHVLARALEQTARDPGVRGLLPGGRRWWALRLLPVLVCLPPIGHTLMRGQANLLLLALVCGMTAALLRGVRLRAGLWLAGAACLKIFPLYLVLVPVCRRDGRCLAGCLLGLVLGLLVLPALWLGPEATARCYGDLAGGLVAPALHLNEDQSRAKELIEQTATDSQSFVSVLHNTLYLDRSTRPDVASPAVQRVHWVLGGLFTLLTLGAARRRYCAGGPALALFVGCLALLMVVLSPVCHTHYFVMALPLVMGLLAWAWEEDLSPGQRRTLLLVLALQIVGQSLPLLPGCEVLKDAGLALYAALGLWLAGCLALYRGGESIPAYLERHAKLNNWQPAHVSPLQR